MREVDAGVVWNVCVIPGDSHRLQNRRSVVDLIQESGYLENPTALTFESVRAFLSENPSLVKEWEAYSADKRVDRGWFLDLDGEKPEVGYFHARKGRTQQQSFDSPIDACAAYILREADDIANPHFSRSYRVARDPVENGCRSLKVNRDHSSRVEGAHIDVQSCGCNGAGGCGNRWPKTRSPTRPPSATGAIVLDAWNGVCFQGEACARLLQTRAKSAASG